MKAYIDTSFLISLYSRDTNSSAAIQTMQNSQSEHFISEFVELEVVNALQLRVFRKELSASEAQLSLRCFEKDVADRVLKIFPLTEQVFDRAKQLSVHTTARLGTRTADLLHVAAALELKADFLYSFDQHQRKLAQLVKLKLN